MPGDDSDKTEEPTEHKLQEARKKGNVCKSMDMVQTMLLAATAGLLYGIRSHFVNTIVKFAHWSWGLIAGPVYIDERSLFHDGLQVVITYFSILAPLFAMGVVIGILANIAQIKMLLTFEPLKPKLDKFNPVQGFKKIFSMKSFVELLKQLAKLGVVLYVCVNVLKGQIMSLKNSVNWEIPTTLSIVRSMAVKLVAYVIAAMIVISILDYIFQKKQYLKQMKMSIKELRDEYKDTEGNPQVKGKLKQIARQNLQRIMKGQVAGSSAVVCNPTHLAVAIRYKPGEDKAPVVTAKGQRLIAVQIKIMAEENDIPVIENVELARALYSSCEVGAAIPVELYKATAEVLAYIFRLKKKRELMRKRRYMPARTGTYAGQM
jgi:flagellar biosynthetic protein FlhB